MKVVINDKKFMSDMMNITEYAVGFLEGAQKGKQLMLNNLGAELKELIGEFIDSNARLDPESLHHVYEWYQTGSKDARLFDIDYTTPSGTLRMNSSFSQSSTVSNTSDTPFYDKARIMESGVPITIRPKTASMLVFEENGEIVFTRNPVTVSAPGGQATTGSFERVFRSFFDTYSSQSILDISGLSIYLKNPVEFKEYFGAGKRSGKSIGIVAGMKFISGGKK